MDILAIGAHPDDVEISAGGLLLIEIARGHRAAIVDLSGGERATRGEPAERRREATHAAERLGLEWRHGLGLADTEIRDDGPARRRLVEVLRAARPRLLIGPAAADPHPDHRAAAALTRAAWFLAGLARYAPELGAPHRAPQHLEMHGRIGARPALLVPIDAVWESKLAVLACHASQLAPGAVHRLGDEDPVREVDTVARALGLLAGCERAEGFDAPDGWVAPALLLR